MCAPKPDHQLENQIAELKTALGKAGDDISPEVHLKAKTVQLEASLLLVKIDNDEPPSRTRFVWEQIKWFLELPIAVPIVLTVITLLITGTVQDAIALREVEVAEQQFNVETVAAISERLELINKEPFVEEIARQEAAIISFFGSSAVFPLFIYAASPSTKDETRKILEDTLVSMSVESANRKRICSVILENKSRKPGTSLDISIKKLEAEIDCETE